MKQEVQAFVESLDEVFCWVVVIGLTTSIYLKTASLYSWLPHGLNNLGFGTSLIGPFLGWFFNPKMILASLPLKLQNPDLTS